jgi:glycerate kinase
VPIILPPDPRRVLVAPNAFKGTLSAHEAAEAMAVGVHRARPDAEVRLLPLADGGDGSVDAFVAAGYSPVSVEVRGPTGVPGRALIAVQDGQAVVELANACGLSRLPGGVAAPMTSSTLGLGDALLGALATGATAVTVCLGGSASTDGGAGMLVALGARLLDDAGRTVAPSGAELLRIARLDVSGLDPRLRGVAITVAVDVGSPLHGPAGAAAVFGPQKGATSDDVALLDAGLRHWSSALAAATGRDVAALPGSGAAGGTAAALVAVLGATTAPGAGLIADLVGLDAAIEHADLVITGEGRLDEQTVLGKGAADVAARCLRQGRPAVAVCGEVGVSADAMDALGFASWGDCLAHATDPADAMRRPVELVALATEQALRRGRG